MAADGKRLTRLEQIEREAAVIGEHRRDSAFAALTGPGSQVDRVQVDVAAGQYQPDA